ncbi:MAG: NAD(P)-dependent oxidoreductase [Desulfobacteraceae bacterium]|nr:NAD(P)-dependent oxidoreductase [Desulfobacteraceae bacterium]
MGLSPQKTVIGFIGTGVMGSSMAGHILNAGFALHVYNRTKSRADNLVSKGAVWEDTIAGLSANCDVIITIVGMPGDVEAVYFSEDGILNHVRPGTIVIDMTTSSPELAKNIYQSAKERAIESLDAPVSGGDLGARNATLSIMVGGDEKIFDKLLPLFEIMGKNIVYQGEPGTGQHTKIANQIAIAASMVAVCESLAYAKKAGLDQKTVLKSIGPGAAGSWSLNNLGPRMIADDFDPGFFIKHFMKDMKIAANSSKDLGLATPGLDLARSLYQKLIDQGCENEGTQALYKLFK